MKITFGVSFRSSRTKRAWYEMKRRCTRSGRRSDKWYAGKGIQFDPRWADYTEFLKDMGECPSGYTLDRIDPTKGYEKENCRWANWHTQQANRTNNNKVTGVAFHKASGKWRAYIKPKDKQISLGYYREYDEAVVARRKAEEDLGWW